MLDGWDWEFLFLTTPPKLAGGNLSLKSIKGKGNQTHSNLSTRAIWTGNPMGNISTTIITLIAGNSFVDFIYKHRHNDRRFALDTREIRNEIEDLPINHPEIIKVYPGRY